jgi:hypothetical protein
MTTLDRIGTAYRAADPGDALRALVLQLASEGHSKAEIDAALQEFVLALRSRPGHRDTDEDIVLDTLDALHGWCHPSAWLLPNQ